jgi:thiamine-phosphate diphosphorylase
MMTAGNGRLDMGHGPVSRSPLPVPVLHAVTTDEILLQPDFLYRARGVMQAVGARGALHVRGYRIGSSRLFELACALVPVQQRTGAWLVVNDRFDVALAAGAWGAQLTTRSVLVADARQAAAALRLGASVHDARQAAAAAPADWIVVGHVYETASHDRAPGGGVQLIREVVAATSLPCIAIGGVRPGDVSALRDAGAWGVAAISGIWGARDAERAAIEYLSAHERWHSS